MHPSKYPYQAYRVLCSLLPKTQLAIEHIRMFKLADLIANGTAHVYNSNTLEYYCDIPALQVRLYFYETYTGSRDIIIFQIDYPLSKPNGHAKLP